MKTPLEALEITRKYWGDVPVKVFELAAELGLGPVFATLPENISGMIQRVVDDQWRIVVNKGHARVRQRFTVAHELGHFIYHRERLADGVSDTLAFRADDEELPNPRIGREQEWQANNFAANLLIPNHYLRAAQTVGITDPQELAERFDVSLATMKIKLGLTRQPTLFDNERQEPAPQVDRFGLDRMS